MSFNCKAYIKLIDLDKNTKMISITSRPNTAEKEKVKETTAKSKVIQKTSNFLMMTNIKVNHSTRLAHVSINAQENDSNARKKHGLLNYDKCKT